MLVNFLSAFTVFYNILGFKECKLYILSLTDVTPCKTTYSDTAV